MKKFCRHFFNEKSAASKCDLRPFLSLGQILSKHLNKNLRANGNKKIRFVASFLSFWCSYLTLFCVKSFPTFALLELCGKRSCMIGPHHSTNDKVVLVNNLYKFTYNRANFCYERNLSSTPATRNRAKMFVHLKSKSYNGNFPCKIITRWFGALWLTDLLFKGLEPNSVLKNCKLYL